MTTTTTSLIVEPLAFLHKFMLMLLEGIEEQEQNMATPTQPSQICTLRLPTREGKVISDWAFPRDVPSAAEGSGCRGFETCLGFQGSGCRGHCLGLWAFGGLRASSSSTLSCRPSSSRAFHDFA